MTEPVERPIERPIEKIVTIFGGSKCGEDDPEYDQARRVGELLAEAGFTICTGGYLGVMEAASRGAHEAVAACWASS